MRFVIKCEQLGTSTALSGILILSDNNRLSLPTAIYSTDYQSVIRFERIYPGKDGGVAAPGGKREALTAGEGFVRRCEINQFRYFNITLTRLSLQLWTSTPVLFAMTKTDDRGQGRP
jgi:hypothetical protein